MKPDKYSDKLLTAFVIVSALWHTTAFAAPLDALPSSPHKSATLPAIEQRANSFASTIWAFLKGLAILIGLWMVMSSFMKIRAISNGTAEGSIWGAWAGAFIGGMMAAVGTWLFAVSRTAEELVGI